MLAIIFDLTSILLWHKIGIRALYITKIPRGTLRSVRRTRIFTDSTCFFFVLLHCGFVDRRHSPSFLNVKCFRKTTAAVRGLFTVLFQVWSELRYLPSSATKVRVRRRFTHAYLRIRNCLAARRCNRIHRERPQSQLPFSSTQRLIPMKHPIHLFEKLTIPRGSRQKKLRVAAKSGAVLGRWLPPSIC